MAYSNRANSVEVLNHYMSILHLPSAISDGMNRYRMKGPIAERKLGTQALKLLVVEKFKTNIIDLGCHQLHQLNGFEYCRRNDNE